MSIGRPCDFRLSFVSEDTETAVPSAAEILSQVASRPEWDAASIAPGRYDFPRLNLEWRANRGFLIQCYETEESWSDFLSEAARCGSPVVEVELGGQALERWPAELFVSEGVARRAVDYFLRTGKQDPELHWVRLDAFPRETIWEGSDEKEAWEREHQPRSKR